MLELQPVIVPPAQAALFLVVTITPGREETVRDLLEDVSGLCRSVAFRAPDDELSCVVGIASEAWDRLFSGPRPRDLHPFVELAGERHRAPATPGDLLFHVRGRRMDLCFELARLIAERLSGAVTVVDEVHGFKYFDERDLLGFVDGSENAGGRVAADAVLIGDEDPDFRGGSYVIVQKYLHDMTAWNALPTEEQDKVIGRTKLTNVAPMTSSPRTPTWHSTPSPTRTATSARSFARTCRSAVSERASSARTSSAMPGLPT